MQKNVNEKKVVGHITIRGRLTYFICRNSVEKSLEITKEKTSSPKGKDKLIVKAVPHNQNTCDKEGYSCEEGEWDFGWNNMK